MPSTSRTFDFYASGQNGARMPQWNFEDDPSWPPPSNAIAIYVIYVRACSYGNSPNSIGFNDMNPGLFEWIRYTYSLTVLVGHWPRHRGLALSACFHSYPLL